MKDYGFRKPEPFEVKTTLKNTIFFHVPKCAGTSFIEVLNYLYGADNQVICPAVVDEDLNKCLASGDVGQYKLFKGHFAVGTAARIPCFDDAFKISIFRHPIDRCISLYGYLRGHSQEDLEVVNDYQKSHILYAKAFDLMDILSLPDDSLWKIEYTRSFSQFVDYKQTPSQSADQIISTLDLIGFVDCLHAFTGKIKLILWNDKSIDYSLPRMRESTLSSELVSSYRDLLSDTKLARAFDMDIEIYERLRCELGEFE